MNNGWVGGWLYLILVGEENVYDLSFNWVLWVWCVIVFFKWNYGVFFCEICLC